MIKIILVSIALPGLLGILFIVFFYEPQKGLLEQDIEKIKERYVDWILPRG